VIGTNVSDKKKLSVGDIVEFGSYSQSEISGSELTDSITGASYDSNGVAIVGGTKVKRLKKSEVTSKVENDWGSDA